MTKASFRLMSAFWASSSAIELSASSTSNVADVPGMVMLPAPERVFLEAPYCLKGCHGLRSRSK